MPDPLYQITNWRELYETNETRKLKSLLWVKVPNKMDGLSFRLLAKNQDGAEIFAAWILMLQIASKADPRGTLSHNNLPLSPGEMGEITGFPGNIFSKALKFLSSPKIGWIEQISPSPDASGENPDPLGKSPATPSVEEGKEGNGMEGKEREEGSGFATGWKSHDWFSNPEFLRAWKGWVKERKKSGTERNLATLVKLSGDDITGAISILDQSADSGWTGLFELKKSKNGSPIKTNSRTEREGREYHEDLKL